MIIQLFLIAAGLAVLTAGATMLVRGAASLALRVGLTPLVIGLTVVAFGTSAPELLVSVQAALRGAGGIAVGNVVGSNVANLALILGVAALVRPVPTSRSLLRRDVPLMIGASVVLALMLADKALGRAEGALLLAALFAYIGYSVRAGRRETAALALAEDLPPPSGHPLVDGVLLVGGLAALIGGAHLFVESAVALAQALGVSNAVIGLTVVAVGTSLPELATTLVAAVRGESGIAAGNVVGSNLFNVLGILSVAALARPLTAPGIGGADLLVMVAVAVAILPLLASGGRLSRLEGGVLLAGYAAYMFHLAQNAGPPAL
ncbi:MAG: calcium/sodium antiporter [Rubricoccaceae bacterium]